MSTMSLAKVKAAAAHLAKQIDAPYGSVSIRSSFSKGIDNPLFIVTIYPGKEGMVKAKPSEIDGINVEYQIQSMPIAYAYA